VKEKIYAQYLEAFKKGVFNYIKEDVDAVSQQPARASISPAEKGSIFRKCWIAPKN